MMTIMNRIEDSVIDTTREVECEAATSKIIIINLIIMLPNIATIGDYIYLSTNKYVVDVQLYIL